jgi:hypothetical protein
LCYRTCSLVDVLSAASNWLWNCITAVTTPYMVDRDKGNLGVKRFFV